MNKSYFGQFGGQFVSELFYPALKALEEGFAAIQKDNKFQKQYKSLLADYCGRPTPLYFATNLSKEIGCRVYLKREDLMYGGSHKLNNALGQALLAKKMGKKRLITETAAGMHGVATCLAANVVGLTADVYMGVKDIVRQTINAEKITLLGGTIHPVTRGEGVLKDAVSESMSVWVEDLKNSHYLIGSSVGPHPYPAMVSYFQSIIGKELKKQILEKEGKLPTAIIACGSGGSNAIGAFGSFVSDISVRLIFVEGGPFTKNNKNLHAAAFSYGSVGVFQGAKTYLLQDQFGMDKKTESRSAGLNYPARGPELSHLFATGRMEAHFANDKEVLNAFSRVSKLEGLIPAFETCHAFAYLLKNKEQFSKDDVIVINFSGRGEKDVAVATSLKLKVENSKL